MHCPRPCDIFQSGCWEEALALCEALGTAALVLSHGSSLGLRWFSHTCVLISSLLDNTREGPSADLGVLSFPSLQFGNSLKQ